MLFFHKFRKIGTLSTLSGFKDGPMLRNVRFGEVCSDALNLPKKFPWDLITPVHST